MDTWIYLSAVIYFLLCHTPFFSFTSLGVSQHNSTCCLSIFAAHSPHDSNIYRLQDGDTLNVSHKSRNTFLWLSENFTQVGCINLPYTVILLLNLCWKYFFLLPRKAIRSSLVVLTIAKLVSICKHHRGQNILLLYCRSFIRQKSGSLLKKIAI